MSIDAKRGERGRGAGRAKYLQVVHFNRTLTAQSVSIFGTGPPRGRIQHVLGSTGQERELDREAESKCRVPQASDMKLLTHAVSCMVKGQGNISPVSSADTGADRARLLERDLQPIAHRGRI